jgi:hypothetical protein
VSRPARPIPARDVEHLAILVVYYLKDDEDLPLLRMHLERIARHTKVPYTLYAVVNRLSAAGRALLDEHPNVVIADVPSTDLRASREHGYYLDALVPLALADGASHICTLDVDSFPIDDAWVDVVADAAPPASGFAGILRAENSDVLLPHPSCTMARREFFERYAPSFSPDSDGTPEFRQFLRSTGQAADTGIRVGYVLWTHALPWGHLVRTNVVNPHYLMAGIYADVVFHLGSVGRGFLFRKDLESSLVHRLSGPIERFPVRGRSMLRAKKHVLRRLRFETEDRFTIQNKSIYALLRNWLFSDPEGMLAYLRGAPATDEAVPPGLSVVRDAFPTEGTRRNA